MALRGFADGATRDSVSISGGCFPTFVSPEADKREEE
jgi:hypothetical protein